MYLHLDGTHLGKQVYILCGIYIHNFQWNVIFITFNALPVFSVPVRELWWISSPEMIFIPFTSLHIIHLCRISRPVVDVILYWTAYQLPCRLLDLNFKLKMNEFMLLMEPMFWAMSAFWFWGDNQRMESKFMDCHLQWLHYIFVVLIYAHTYIYTLHICTYACI